MAGAVRGLCDASWVAFGEADAALAGCDVIIQATSCGMLGGPPAADMLRDVPLARCRKRTFALDVVYVPVETPWLAVDTKARTASVSALPDGSSVPFALNVQLVVEYYSQRL